MTTIQPAGAPRGFTLIEILVALAVVALLTALLTPMLAERVDDADATQTLVQLDHLGTAARTFRLDMGQWPREPAQLADAPGTGSASRLDLFDRPIEAPGAWRGPYLKAGRVRGGIEIRGVGTVLSPFAVAPWGGDDFLAIAVSGVSRDEAERVMGAAGPGGRDRIRWRQGPEGGVLIYLADPVHR